MDESEREQMANLPQARYVKARSALLDALDTLGPNRSAVILVGAQAIYMHTGEIGFAVAPFTYDADLGIDPRELGPEPRIVDAMKSAGFSQAGQPGLYTKADGSQVDLLVPQSLGGAGRRGARLGSHGNTAAMKVHGLEGALVEHSPRLVGALDAADSRSHVIKVAGPGALLVAKAHKLAERAEQELRRQDDKDAFDIYRILRAISTADLATRLVRLGDHDISAAVTREALSRFENLFGSAAATGTQMVARHVEGLEDVTFIAASSVALSQDLLRAIRNLPA